VQRHVTTLLLALIVVSSPVAAAAQTPRPPHITVSGEGTASVAPDLAIIQAGMTTQGRTAREASAANSTAMTKVQAALKADGMAERDMQTARFSIRPLHSARRDGDNRITGFEASNQISVKVREIARLATVLDQMIAAGANSISSVHFTVSEHSKLLDQARVDAVADARRKAELLAKAAGAQLGRATAIVENGGGGRPEPVARMAMQAAAASVPVVAGEQTLRVQVSVTFELKH
jgi:uncharacterized protein YggE